MSNNKPKINRKVATLNVDLYNAIYWYLNLTKPLSKLIASEVSLVSIILYMYHMSKEKDVEKKWKNTFSYDNKIRMMEKMDINKGTLNNYLTGLRNKEVLINNKIIPSLNPFIDNDADIFEVILRFKLKK